jgi:hypothetical protein
MLSGVSTIIARSRLVWFGTVRHRFLDEPGLLAVAVAGQCRLPGVNFRETPIASLGCVPTSRSLRTRERGQPDFQLVWHPATSGASRGFTGRERSDRPAVFPTFCEEWFAGGEPDDVKSGMPPPGFELDCETRFARLA